MTKRPAFRVAFALLVVLVPPALAAQEPAEPQQPPVALFTASSDLVVLHVNVVDRGGKIVEDLLESAFEVYEDGIRQDIQFFEPREAPIAAGLVVDRSSSMLTRHKMVRTGVEAFAELSRPNDEFFTIVFNENVHHGLPPELAFTRSRDLLLASLGRAPAGGKTALHDAVIEGLAHLETASNQKRVLVVLSDGDDNASSHAERNMLHRAAQSSAAIYTIWTGDVSATRGDPGLLRKLARRNGGVAYEPSNEGDIVEAFRTVAQTMRRGYTIGYPPTNSATDGTYRRIKVLVRAPGSRLTIHVRDGYTAREGSVR
jgi:Ca-activated chloride channel family protein